MMSEDLKKYVNDNREVLNALYEAKEKLQIGMDLLQPIIPEFKEVHPDHNLAGSCSDCILDMVLWALINAKN